MTDNVVAAVARATAAELAPQYGSRLRVEVENALEGNGGHPGQYLDPLALGALIVAITQFGYQVYSDRAKSGSRPTRETLTQALRIERRDPTGAEQEIIEVVSTKIIESGPGQS